MRKSLANALQFERRLAEALKVPANPQRRRIWELNASLHCSIIGTCLSTSELRQLLIKLQIVGAATATDHDLHGQAVTLASSRGVNAKQLQKALDRRHRATVAQFEKAHCESEVRDLWSAALARGDIPGGYWAGLTHPRATRSLVRNMFGDVHMLSHLVGAANRADIRRLSALETEKAALEEKVARQQERLREAMVERDATVRTLNQMLAQRLSEAAKSPAAPDRDAERKTLEALVGDLQKRLSAETRRRARAEERQQALQDSLEQASLTGETARQALAELRREMMGAEAALAALSADDGPDSPAIDLEGLSLLYVGGKAHLAPQMRALAEQCAAHLQHHDGGMEANVALLSGLVGRADVVLFPVDCISHEAAGAVKRICRQAGKSYLPLRSAGLSSYAAALHTIAAMRAQQAAPHVARKGDSPIYS